MPEKRDDKDDDDDEDICGYDNDTSTTIMLISTKTTHRPKAEGPMSDRPIQLPIQYDR